MKYKSWNQFEVLPPISASLLISSRANYKHIYTHYYLTASFFMIYDNYLLLFIIIIIYISHLLALSCLFSSFIFYLCQKMCNVWLCLPVRALMKSFLVCGNTDKKLQYKFQLMLPSRYYCHCLSFIFHLHFRNSTCCLIVGCGLYTTCVIWDAGWLFLVLKSFLKKKSWFQMKFIKFIHFFQVMHLKEKELYLFKWSRIKKL